MLINCGIPWGISEAAFNLKDLNSNYQYKAFGIPWLGLKRGLADEMVVSSYGSILAISDFPNEVIQNLRNLEKQGMYGKYGFYESIDYTPDRLPVGKTHVVVKTYMAHHQALILLSINNLINDNILQKRFMQNPEIKAIDILLQERMPLDMLITKEKKEKTKKIKYTGYDNYIETVYTEIDEDLRKANVISNEDYMICINDKGDGFSKYKDILINRYKETKESGKCGIFFYIRDVETKDIWRANYEVNQKCDKYEVTFAEDMSKFVKINNGIETSLKIIAPENIGTEIRCIKIKNNTEKEKTLDVMCFFEPILSKMEEDIAHPAFNNLFLKYSLSDDNDLIVKRNKRGNTNEVYLGCNLAGQEEDKLEYEIDLSNVYDWIESEKSYTSKIGLTTSPCASLKRRIKINPNEEKILTLIISVSEKREDVMENLRYYKIQENVEREFKISKAKVTEEARYLGATSNDLKTYQKLLPYIIYQNPLKSLYLKDLTKKEYKQSDLWKYGISGDLPILLFTVKSMDDMYMLKEMLKAHEYFRAKGIKTDLVILDYEKNIYEQYVREQAMQEILNMQIGYLQNVSSGIFLLNVNEIEDEDLFKMRANIIIESGKTSVMDEILDQEGKFKKVSL